MPDFANRCWLLPLGAAALACNVLPRPSKAEGTSSACQLVEDGFGPSGAVKVKAEVVVQGLRVPWGIAFLSETEWLVTERAGRLRLIREGTLEKTPVLQFEQSESDEGGLLGIALHPDFQQNRLFYVYRTVETEGEAKNRVERYKLGDDARTAASERVIIDKIPAAKYHDGGRIRFGPDGMLYVGTGDARKPDSAQDVNSPSGKILRLKPDGSVPEDNPFRAKPSFIMGIRNTQGFDWRDRTTLLVTDHGPSGEMLRSGHDEVSVARPGANLGWPTIYGCDRKSGMVSPSLSWRTAVPPGGAAIYAGSRIPEWKDSLMVASLKGRHLQRIVFEKNDPRKVSRHEVYLRDEHGRLRDVVMGPDDHLYVTTSNCDGRGDCPASGDTVLRIVPQSRKAD